MFDELSPPDDDFTFVDGREYDIMINKLAPLHYHHSIANMRSRHVVVDVGGDKARGWQRLIVD